MTAPTTPRRTLPLTPTHSGGRDRMTCRYRCGDACFQEVPNTSSNRTFRDIVNAAVSRRTALRAGGLGAAVVGLAWGAGAAAAPAAAGTPTYDGRRVPFQGIDPTPADVDDVIVPADWDWAPIISWGDPISPEAPDFDFWDQTPQAQRQQAGYNCDYVTLFKDSADRGVLVFNNEYTNDELIFSDISGPEDLTDEQLEIVMAAHGMTVVEVERAGRYSPWTYDRAGARNRRIHAWTPFTVSGAAAGHEALRTAADPTGRHVLGTLNNCAGGETPWGTVLSGEENFNQYFDTTGAPDPQERLARYGVTSAGRGWERVESRFSVLAEPNEVNRFGWIVEVDPEDPDSTPVKHTALGRFKHEGATIQLAADGHAVAYMGDDERFDYIYKFVSAQTYVEGDKAHNMTLLEEGDLYVARFDGEINDPEFDGTGVWIPLVVDGQSHVPGWSVAEVLIWTRQAADAVEPTKMDRPEDVEPHPVTGRVYAALTNNTDRTSIDPANPRPNNKHGHVIEITEDDEDHTGTTFQWRIVLLAGDPADPTTYFLGFDKSLVSPISCPDNVAFDALGNVWIATDGMPGTLDLCDGMYLYPVHGPRAGYLQQFLSVPAGAECCGPFVDLEDNTVLAAVQHPGEVSGAHPGNVQSLYPYLGDGQPRPGVLHAYRLPTSSDATPGGDAGGR